jgi:WD40 repeat protein
LHDQSLATFGGPNRKLGLPQFLDRDLLLFNDEKTVTVQDLSRRTENFLLEDQDGIRMYAYCPEDTNLFATVTDDGRIKVWDVAAKRVRVELEGHSGSAIKSLCFSRDGRWLASAGGNLSVTSDNSIKLWDVAAGNPRPVRTFFHYAYIANAVAFSRDSRQLFASGSEGRIRAWDLTTGAQGAPLEGHAGWVWALAPSPDGHLMASGASDSVVIVWDLLAHKPLTRLFGHSGGVSALAFSPDSHMLATGGYDQTIRLCDLSTEKQPALLRGHRNMVNSLSFSPDGQLLVSQSDDGVVKLWQATSGQESTTLMGNPETLNDVALSPDGKLLASVAWEKPFAVNLWDLQTRSRIILTGHTDMVTRAVFSPDGRILATGSHDQTVRLWDVRDRKAMATLTNGFPVGSLAFSPDGRTLVVGGSWLNFLIGLRAGLQFWDVPSQQPAGTLQGEVSDVLTVAWSADGALLATGHNDGLRLWDAATRRLLHRFATKDRTESLAFSPTERLVAADGQGGNILLYDIATMKVLEPALKAAATGVGSLTFSPDGRTLASYGDGGGLKLWQVATRQLALTLKGHLGPVSGIAFSRDGNLMVSAGVDSTVRLWPAATLEEVGASTTEQSKP